MFECISVLEKLIYKKCFSNSAPSIDNNKLRSFLIYCLLQKLLLYLASYHNMSLFGHKDIKKNRFGQL